MINELAQQIHQNNIDKGFYEEEKNIGEMLALIHSEVSEALEADRKNSYHNVDGQPMNRGNWAMEIVNTNEEAWINWFNLEIKHTFEDELADIIIRVMDLAAFKGIDLEKHIAMKMRYNSLREYKHGKKY